MYITLFFILIFTIGIGIVIIINIIIIIFLIMLPLSPLVLLSNSLNLHDIYAKSDN